MLIKNDYCLLFCKGCEYYKQINRNASNRVESGDPSFFSKVFNIEKLENNGKLMTKEEKEDLLFFTKHNGKIIHMVINDIKKYNLDNLYLINKISKITISMTDVNLMNNNLESFLQMYESLKKIKKLTKLRILAKNSAELKKANDIFNTIADKIHFKDDYDKSFYGKMHIMTLEKTERSIQKLIIKVDKDKYCNKSMYDVREVYEN